MNDAFSELAQLDRTLHAPPRLAILTVLLNCTRADFTFLITATGLTKGNLASNLARLEAAGLVTAEKEVRAAGVRTTLRLTGKGREATEAHWAQLERIKQRVVPVGKDSLWH